jgi:hypothetical protein
MSSRQSDSIALLVDCLRKHDIRANFEELKKAQEGASASVLDAWIAEHLGPETLLSRDELSL